MARDKTQSLQQIKHQFCYSKFEKACAYLFSAYLFSLNVCIYMYGREEDVVLISKPDKFGDNFRKIQAHEYFHIIYKLSEQIIH